jgi:hypothetical protein
VCGSVSVNLCSYHFQVPNKLNGRASSPTKKVGNLIYGCVQLGKVGEKLL